MLEGSFGEGEFGESSYIRAELWLPDDWNGIFVGLGNGGMAGSFVYESLKMNVEQGYAVVQTDLGTSRGVSFGIGNPEVWRDFGWRATHWMTVTAKAIIENHYQKKPRYSYFVAESTGGEQALSEAQRFHEDYDGIIAGVPANNRVFLHTMFLWGSHHLVEADGTLLFTPDETRAISTYAVDFFESRGIVKEGEEYITYPYLGKDTADLFLEYHRSKNEFSHKQLHALKAVYNGPVNPKNGKRIYCGVPIGSERFGGVPTQPRSLKATLYPFGWALGADFDLRSFDFDRDLERVSNLMSAEMNANDPDLSEFRDHGGKLLVYSGTCDGMVPYPDAAQYVDRVYENTADAARFLRYFIVPGKDHSIQGTGVNSIGGSSANLKSMLDILRKWCENGEAPDILVGERIENDKVNFSVEIPCYVPGSLEYPEACDTSYLEK